MPFHALARMRVVVPLLAIAALVMSGCSSDHSPTQPANGSLSITVNGLPAGASGALVVTGPHDYSAAVTHSSTLSNLAPGSYQIAAASIASHDTNYVPSPETATVTVASGSEPATATIVYSRSTTTLDLSITAMYLTQSTQTLSGAVPLVANRDGFLRVFVIANRANTVAPKVRVRFYINGTLQGSPTIISAPTSSVPTTVSQASLTSSWNIPVPGSMIRPGLSILADVDPTQSIPEIARSNNSFPVSGTPLALTVNNLPTFYIRFVPVKQSVNNLTGDVSSANKDALLVKTMKIHPIAAYSADVHATYTTSALALTGGNGNSAWNAVLSEIQALRVAEGSPRNYFGIVRTSYTSGIVGISYIGGAASVGYDGATALEIVSHELGHSWGRQHAPCGISGTTDSGFPYAAGNIGVYGFDVATSTIYPPSTAEVMSYCHPQWISDYTYSGVYSYRLGHPSAPDFVHADFQPCMIVWGRVIDGRVELEPSFQVLTHPSLPEKRGAYRLRALDASGSELYSLSFDGDSIADAPGAGRAFAYAIPLAQMSKPIASLVLAGSRGSVRRDAAFVSARTTIDARALATAIPPTARRVGNGASIAWNAQRYPLAVVRDAKSGEILSLARGGVAAVQTNASDLELTLSDGVQSTVVQSHVAP